MIIFRRCFPKKQVKNSKIVCSYVIIYLGLLCKQTIIILTLLFILFLCLGIIFGVYIVRESKVRLLEERILLKEELQDTTKKLELQTSKQKELEDNSKLELEAYKTAIEKLQRQICNICSKHEEQRKQFEKEKIICEQIQQKFPDIFAEAEAFYNSGDLK